MNSLLCKDTSINMLTTMKWEDNGELSLVDMDRVIGVVREQEGKNYLTEQARTGD